LSACQRAAGGDFADTADGVVDAGQDPRGFTLQELAGGSERHLPGGAVEQRDVQLGLELPNRIRERRLRHVQLLGGLPEVAGLGNRGRSSMGLTLSDSVAATDVTGAHVPQSMTAIHTVQGPNFGILIDRSE
jgi:hypothetical protein